MTPTAGPRADAPLRHALSLDGPWDFRHSSGGGWAPIRVPGPWQAQVAGLAWSLGTGHYRRRVPVPADWAGREVALRFGAVTEAATVRVDGREVARHEGGYLPFEALLPDGCAGREVQVEVDAAMAEPADFPETPHGKQSWYGPQGGIWQGVTLEARDPAHIAHLRLDAHWPEGRLDVLATPSRPGGRLRVEVRDGATVLASAEGVAGEPLSLAVPGARPWSPDAPHLHAVHATLLDGPRECDRRVEAIGFRRIEARDGALWLNGEPLYLRAALDQDYYPDGTVTAPSLELLESQARQAKAMGLNCLRLHIKVPDPRYHEVADRLGLLVWAEIPNVETFTPLSARRLRACMEGILRRDRNHPSIVVWSLVNEDWGTRLSESAEQRAWIAATYDWLKAEDPLRLVVDNSACFPNRHVVSDLDDYHFYRGPAERPEEWQALCAEFAARPAWSWTPAREGRRTGREPLVQSEFGVWGLPDPAQLKAEGADPWWAAFGASWADGAALPQGIEARFAELELGRVWGSLAGFVADAQRVQGLGLKWQIEELRRHPSIVGHVITEWTDVHWEGNGLLDMHRRPRSFVPALPRVLADVVVAPGLAHPAAREGGALRFDLRVATGGARLPEGARLRWRLGEASGEAGLPATGPLAAAALSLSVPVAGVPAPRADAVAFEVLAPDGAVLSHNDQAVALFPARPAPPRPVRAHAPDQRWGERLRALGHEDARAADAEVHLAGALDATLVEAIHDGARVLLIPQLAHLRADPVPRDAPLTMPIEDAEGGTATGAYFVFPGYALVNRHRTLWRGDWLGNFSWLRRDGAFAAIPGGPMLDPWLWRTAPRQVIAGLRPWEFAPRVHAGVVVGWVHKPAAFVVEKALGRGRLVVSTFRLLRDGPDADPVATALLDGLLALARDGS